MNKTRKFGKALSALLLSLVLLIQLVSCTADSNAADSGAAISVLEITNCERQTLQVGDSYQLLTNVTADLFDDLIWTASNESVTVDGMGNVTAVTPGKVTVTVCYGELSDTVLFEVVEASAPLDPIDPPPDTLPDLPSNAEREEFYGDYEPATSNAEAANRSKQGLISGSITVPDQAPVLASYQPTRGGVLVRNSQAYYLDEDTYVVVNAKGEEMLRIFRDGGYITLEEVAAYVYAFGDVPANYVSGKKADPAQSIWGQYLRVNHSKFSGDTRKYPYEPALPNISGCGGNFQYFELDIGTTGTDCDPGYIVYPYNDGFRITRGAARIVYARYDVNGNRLLEPEERFVFYTYNHYNDFQEYLNYFGGWGKMFGNVTGGGTLSSKSDYNPTPYIAVVVSPLTGTPKAAILYSIYPTKVYGYAA